MSELEYYTPKMIDAMADALALDGPPYQYPSHLQPILNREQRRRTVDICIERLKSIEFDTLAFSGVSGSSIGFILAQLLDKEVISVRQPGVRRRAGNTYLEEGYRHAMRYIIVDDLISTGVTAARVVHGVEKIAPQAKLVGLLMYYGNPKLLLSSAPFSETYNSYEWSCLRSALGAKEIRNE